MSNLSPIAGNCQLRHHDPGRDGGREAAVYCPFCNGLFDLWLAANRSEPTVNIRIVSDMIAALLGNNSPTEGVGYKPIELCTIMTDGSVEEHDVLRIAGDGFTQTTFNIFEHAIDEVRNEPRVKAARCMFRSIFARKCLQRKFMNACAVAVIFFIAFPGKTSSHNPTVCRDDLYGLFENM